MILRNEKGAAHWGRRRFAAGPGEEWGAAGRTGAREEEGAVSHA